jgi:serine/threonine protein kinase
MVVSLVEGQTISAKYSLLHRIAENDFADCWLAVDADLNERVFLKIFKGIITSQEVELISANIERQRGLLHGNITRTYEFEQVGEISFLASQYIQSAKTFSSEGEFSSQWTQLKQVADALEFAHSLGFAHGHLHPDNILVDSENKVSLTDFSYGSPENDQNSAYLSPQIRSNHPVDASDDIYSLGQLLFKSLTGDTFRDGQEFESNLPIPAEFQQLLTSMLHQSPYDRPLDIDMIKAVVDGFATGANDTIDIAATSFNRAAPAPVEVSSEGDHRLPRDINTVSTNKALIGLGVLVVVALAIFAFIPDSEPDRIGGRHHRTTPRSGKAEETPGEECRNCAVAFAGSK